MSTQLTLVVAIALMVASVAAALTLVPLGAAVLRGDVRRATRLSIRLGVLSAIVLVIAYVIGTTGSLILLPRVS
jgi:hypothetical protein